MTRPDGILVVASDPLLRKSVAATLSGLADSGRVESVTPVRATAERLLTAEIVVLAAGDGDLADLRGAIAAVAAAPAPVVLLLAGMADGGRTLAARLQVPPPLTVAIPELDIKGELARAAPRLEAALRQARLQGRRMPEARPEPASPAASPQASDPAQAARSGAPAPGQPYLGPVICIGASTGGTDAVLEVLSGLARGAPPVVVVQHMPEAYVGAFAERLDRACAIEVALAGDNQALRPGLALVAPGGRQLRLRKDARGIWTRLGEAERIGGHCPAVDELMRSAAEQLGRRAIGVLLTGMGRDGADGMLAMRRAGARTVAQDEATSVVYGMPKVAFDSGAADTVLPIGRIAGWISGLSVALAR